MSDDCLPIIVIEKNDEVIANIKWEKEILEVGRGQENDIPLTSPDKGVSRQHLRLERRDGYYFLTDLRSRNGSYVNEQRVEPDHEYEVKEGDKITAGEYTLHFYSSLPTELSSGMDDDATMEYAPAQDLSTSFLVRKKKLEMISDLDKSMWDVAAKRRNKRPLLWTTFIGIALAVMLWQVALYDWQKLPQRWSKPNTKEKQQSVSSAVSDSSAKNVSLPSIAVHRLPEPNGSSVLNAVGYVQANRTVEIRPTLAGKIEYITVREGDKVKEGQVLAKLDQSTIKMQIDIAQTDLKIDNDYYNEIIVQIENAQQRYYSNKKLHQQGLISDQKLDEYRTEYEKLAHRGKRYIREIRSQEQKLNLLRSTLKKAQIEAPFSGVIVERNAEVGFVVKPEEDTLFILADRSTMRVIVEVNEIYSSQIQVGQPTNLVLTAYPDRQYQGKVRRIAPNVNQAKGTVEVEILILQFDQYVLPGMSVKVTFLKEGKKQHKKKIIPQSALVREGEHYWVWVVNSQKQLQRRHVTVASLQQDKAVIKQGLQFGESVVVDPQPGLQEGERVSPFEN